MAKIASWDISPSPQRAKECLMYTSNHLYYHGEHKLYGYLAYEPTQEEKKRPAVLIIHDWSGRNDFVLSKAEQLVAMGYIGFAVDMYGEGQLGITTEEKKALMTPLIEDRELLRDRVSAGLSALVAVPEVDRTRIAAIGFCFGGLCALDLARSGADLAGVVSVHGLLNKPETVKENLISARILALHGYDDPMVPPEAVESFCAEMTRVRADWQVHLYGHTQHAFTNPQAHDAQSGLVYNPVMERRAWQSTADFLQEIFR